MEEATIREIIQAKLASGHLKSHDGGIMVATTGSAQPCAACDKPIQPSDPTPQGHRYSDGDHWFHSRCHELWREERQPKLGRK